MLGLPRHLTVSATLVLVVTTSLTSGCANHTKTGALVGTGVGTGIGAVIGHQIGKGKEGALIGAALGAAGGALVGKKEDHKEEQEAIHRNVAHQEEQRKKYERAMSNFDVLEMVNNQISDPVIINTIQDRGGAFDTSPSGIIQLKRGNVSDTIIMAMQRHNMSR